MTKGILSSVTPVATASSPNSTIRSMRSLALLVSFQLSKLMFPKRSYLSPLCHLALVNLSTFFALAVDPIETEEDRRKALASVSSLMERAARFHAKLTEHRAQIERFLSELTMGSPPDGIGGRAGTSAAGSGAANSVGNSGGGGGSGGSGGNSQTAPALAASTLAAINRSVQLVASCYAVDCKKVFHELSNVNQRVLACRRELAEYDRRQMDLAQVNSSPVFQTIPLQVIVF